MDKLEELMADAQRRSEDTKSSDTAAYWRGRRDAYQIALKVLEVKHNSECMLVPEHDGKCIIPN